MKLPNELKQARQEWLDRRSLTPEKMASQLENDITNVSGEKNLSYMTVRGG